MNVSRTLRNVVIAGAAGLLCGKSYQAAKDHPETVLPIVKLSAASGAAGALLGWSVSAYRNLPTHVYTLSLGANFAITSGVFFGVRHGIMTWIEPAPSTSPTNPSTELQHSVPSWHATTEHVQYISSITSGGIAGSLASVVSRHSVKTIFLTGSTGLVCGLCGQFLYNRFEVWRKKKAVEIHYPELVEQKESRWTFESMQERFLNFWHRSSETVKWDMEIIVLDDAIREEKAKIAKLDKELLKAGVKVDTGPVSVTTQQSDSSMLEDLSGNRTKEPSNNSV